jgi:hypothetical protein
VNTNSFFIEVKDGENPFRYSFIIKAEANGGSFFYSPTLTLTTKCPDHLLYEFSQVETSQFPIESYVGASTVGDGSDSTFTFPKWVPLLPKCV